MSGDEPCHPPKEVLYQLRHMFMRPFYHHVDGPTSHVGDITSYCIITNSVGHGPTKPNSLDTATENDITSGLGRVGDGHGSVGPESEWKTGGIVSFGFATIISRRPPRVVPSSVSIHAVAAVSRETAPSTGRTC